MKRCLSILLCAASFCAMPLAAKVVHASVASCCQASLGDVGFVTHDGKGVEIQTFSYPDFGPLPLTNTGAAQGQINLTSEGLQLNEFGNYWVTFSVIIANHIEPPAQPLYVLSLVRNDEFDVNSQFLTAVATPPFSPAPPTDPNDPFPTPLFTTVTASGNLQNVLPGTTLSLQIANGGSEDPVPVSIIGWQISVVEI
jgi:hypothetical protein